MIKKPAINSNPAKATDYCFAFLVRLRHQHVKSVLTCIWEKHVEYLTYVWVSVEYILKFIEHYILIYQVSMRGGGIGLL